MFLKLLDIIFMLVICAFMKGLVDVFNGIKDKDVGGTGNDAGIVAFGIFSELILVAILIIRLITR